MWRKTALISLILISLNLQNVSWGDQLATSDVLAGKKEEVETPVSDFLGVAKTAEIQGGLVELLPLLDQHEIKYDINPVKRSMTATWQGKTFELKNDVPFLRIDGTVVSLVREPYVGASRVVLRYSDLEAITNQIFQWNEETEKVEIQKEFAIKVQKSLPSKSKTAQDFETLYTVYQMQLDMLYLKDAYPGIINIEHIGVSPDGNALNAITLGTGNENPIIVVAAIHGREYHTFKYAMYELFAMAEAWENNAWYYGYDIRTFLNHHTIKIIPVLNPDGVNISQLGYQASYSGDYLRTAWDSPVDYRIWKADSQGINPNRNFDFRFYEPSGVYNWPHYQYSKGQYPEESRVVKAVADYLRNNASFNATLQLHEKGKIIYWADETTKDMVPGGDWFATQVSAINGYRLMPVTQNLSLMQGGLENWVRLYFHKPSLCMEMSRSNGSSVPNHEALFKTDVYDENRGLLLKYADIAQQWKQNYGQQ